MKKILFGLVVLLAACGPLPPPPPHVEIIAVAGVTDYVYNGYSYSYYNDCGPVYYYNNGTYDATCTYTPDSLMATELRYIGNTLNCPGPSYRITEYVNGAWDLMDYTVDCL